VLLFHVEIVLVVFIAKPVEPDLAVEVEEQLVPSFICHVRTPASVVVALTVKSTSWYLA
jgi:hypothetical protein